MSSATNISNNETVYHKKSTIEHAINSHIFTEKNQLSHIQNIKKTHIFTHKYKNQFLDTFTQKINFRILKKIPCIQKMF